MPTLTASRRALVATALGLMPLSIVALSQVSQMVAAPPAGVACSLLWIQGNLVADNGRAALVRSNIGDVSLDWPDGWTVRPTDDGQLEVVDDTGTVLARTGSAVTLHGVVNPEPGGPSVWVRDGELVVCPYGGSLRAT